MSLWFNFAGLKNRKVPAIPVDKTSEYSGGVHYLVWTILISYDIVITVVVILFARILCKNSSWKFISSDRGS